jgi:hypothetical protein
VSFRFDRLILELTDEQRRGAVAEQFTKVGQAELPLARGALTVSKALHPSPEQQRLSRIGCRRAATKFA